MNYSIISKLLSLMLAVIGLAFAIGLGVSLLEAENAGVTITIAGW